MTTEIIIDYLTITWQSDKISFIIEYFKIPKNELQEGYGTLNYKAGYYIPGCNIRWNYNEYGSISDCCLELSGKGCRLIESLNTDFDWIDFFQIIHFDLLSGQAHIARIDLALDIKDHPIISAKLISNYARAGLYISKSKTLPLIESLRREVVYFGSSKSNRMLRVYNKALEQCLPDTNWTRFELQCRNDCAYSIVMTILGANDIGNAYISTLYSFIRFIEPVKGYLKVISDKHHNRLQTAIWYHDIIQDIKPISKITKPKQDYTYQRLLKYIEKATPTSLKTFILTHDGDLTDVLSMISSAELRPDQIQLLRELGKEITEISPEEIPDEEIIRIRQRRLKEKYNLDIQK